MDLSELDFKYSPLPGPRSLRLLKIERDANVDEGGPTYCKMETFFFTDRPKYVALSYTWDEPEGHREDTGEQNHAPLKCSLLFVDGRRFVGIPLNLSQALLQFRGPQFQHHHHMWIDAICINQSDLAEKASQVNLMGDIYRDAEFVIAWLGQDTGDAQEILESIMLLAKNKAEIRSEYGKKPQPSRSLGNAAFISQIGLQSWTSDRWKRLVFFFCRRWFTRMWVLQEVALAQEVRVVYGNTEIEWCKLANYCEILELTVNTLTSYLPKAVSIHIKWLVRSGVPSMDEFREMVKTSSEGSSFSNVFSTRFTGPRSSVLRASLMLNYLLYRTRAYHAKDQRDKIFALLGILAQIAQCRGFTPIPFVADYEKSVTDVYQDVAQNILKSTQTLDLLSLVHHTPIRASQLPSWVPDYPANSARPLLLPRSDFVISFDASNCTAAPSTNFAIDEARLHVKCYQFGTIVDLGDLVVDIDGRGLFEATARTALNSNLTHITGQSRTEVLWRTLIADHTAREQPAPNEMEVSFLAYLESRLILYLGNAVKSGRSRSDCLRDLVNFDQLLITLRDRLGISQYDVDRQRLLTSEAARKFDEQYTHFRNALTWQGWSRRLFRTSEDHMGLGPESMETDDLVCIISDARTPFVIRKCSEDGDKEYRLVGEAYVHGIMQGEALKQADYKWEDICLI
jgi:hypothetical protein